MYQELERRRNYMSFMVAMKTNNGVIIASDSYSAYPSRGLKDGNYKKIHCMKENELYIGIVGLNQVIKIEDNSQADDINDILPHFFSDITSFEELQLQINQFAYYVKPTCDNECKDISCVFIYKKMMTSLDVLHGKGYYLKIWNDNESDILFMGEEYHKIIARSQFHQADLNLSLKDSLNKCIQTIENAIHEEAKLFEENKRVVGGPIQYMILDYGHI